VELSGNVFQLWRVSNGDLKRPRGGKDRPRHGLVCVCCSLSLLKSVLICEICGSPVFGCGRRACPERSRTGRAGVSVSCVVPLPLCFLTFALLPRALAVRPPRRSTRRGIAHHKTLADGCMFHRKKNIPEIARGLPKRAKDTSRGIHPWVTGTRRSSLMSLRARRGPFGFAQSLPLRLRSGRALSTGERGRLCGRNQNRESRRKCHPRAGMSPLRRQGRGNERKPALSEAEGAKEKTKRQPGPAGALPSFVFFRLCLLVCFRCFEISPQGQGPTPEYGSTGGAGIKCRGRDRPCGRPPAQIRT
jgi:hypothetical protein